jgi:DNA polymerase-3 subunit alpha
LRRVLEPHVAKAEAAPVAPPPAPSGRGGRDGRDGGRRAAPPIPNGLAVQIVYNNARSQGEMRLGEAWRVKPSDTLLAELRSTFGEGAVEIAY